MYNISINLSSVGDYNYTWNAYGNGTSKLFNFSDIRIYSVNASVSINASSAENAIITQTASSSGGTSDYIIIQKMESAGLKLKLYISPNKEITTSVKEDKGTGLKEIELKSKNWLSGEIFVTSYNETPDFCSIEYRNFHKIYRVLNFNNTIKNESIDFGKLKIGISKNWIYSNNISEIKFVRCFPEYEEVNSSYDSETEGEGIYNVYINGFSAYAILGTLGESKISSAENNPWNFSKTISVLSKILFLVFIVSIFIFILLLIKHRVYFKEKIHSKFFDLEVKFRIGKGRK